MPPRDSSRVALRKTEGTPTNFQHLGFDQPGRSDSKCIEHAKEAEGQRTYPHPKSVFLGGVMGKTQSMRLPYKFTDAKVCVRRAPQQENATKLPLCTNCIICSVTYRRGQRLFPPSSSCVFVWIPAREVASLQSWVLMYQKTAGVCGACCDTRRPPSDWGQRASCFRASPKRLVSLQLVTAHGWPSANLFERLRS